MQIIGHLFKIEGKIYFTGRIAHSELIDYFGASDIGLSMFRLMKIITTTLQ
jgi:hypothetical protein